MRALVEREHVLAAELHLARRRLDQPQHAAAGRALAAPRLADQPERFALIDRKAHIVDRLDDGLGAQEPAAALEVLDEMTDFDEWHGISALP